MSGKLNPFLCRIGISEHLSDEDGQESIGTSSEYLADIGCGDPQSGLVAATDSQEDLAAEVGQQCSAEDRIWHTEGAQQQVTRYSRRGTKLIKTDEKYTQNDIRT